MNKIYCEKWKRENEEHLQKLMPIHPPFLIHSVFLEIATDTEILCFKIHQTQLIKDAL